MKKITLIAILLSLSLPAFAKTEVIGKVTQLQGQATILRQTNTIPLNQNDFVQLNDIIETKQNTKIAVVFGDGTSFNIGQNARIELNEFVYNQKGGDNKLLFKLAKGTFTFLAGKTATNGNMKIETPIGTMGIRGTAPHVEILEDGTVKFTTLIETKTETKRPVMEKRSKPVLDICRC